MNLLLEQQQNFLFSQMEDSITESSTDQPEESIVILLTEVPSVKISQPSVSNDFLPIKTSHTMDPGLAIKQSGTTTRNTRKTTGIAFSGGGIRSAAFCSGALCRMLQDNVPLEYLSCVSGGGFTGETFTDWKYRQETNKWNNKKWHNEFTEFTEHISCKTKDSIKIPFKVVHESCMDSEFLNSLIIGLSHSLTQSSTFRMEHRLSTSARQLTLF